MGRNGFDGGNEVKCSSKLRRAGRPMRMMVKRHNWIWRGDGGNDVWQG